MAAIDWDLLTDKQKERLRAAIVNEFAECLTNQGLWEKAIEARSRPPVETWQSRGRFVVGARNFS